MKPLQIKDYKVFFDFDNTISTIDVVDAFLEKFAINDSWLDLEKQWQEGKIGSEDCLKGQISTCKPTQKELMAFLDSAKIDPGFTKLLTFLRQNNIFYAIVSDSFEFFIRYILENNAIKDIPIYANKLNFVDGKLMFSFPYKSKICPQCANCKKERLNFGPLKKIIYVGDGHSDFCAARHSDIVFAKDRLLKFGKEEKFDWIEFRDMNDVLDKLSKNRDTSIFSKTLPAGRQEKIGCVPIFGRKEDAAKRRRS